MIRKRKYVGQTCFHYALCVFRASFLSCSVCQKIILLCSVYAFSLLTTSKTPKKGGQSRMNFPFLKCSFSHFKAPENVKFQVTNACFSTWLNLKKVDFCEMAKRKLTLETSIQRDKAEFSTCTTCLLKKNSSFSGCASCASCERII